MNKCSGFRLFNVGRYAGFIRGCLKTLKVLELNGGKIKLLKVLDFVMGTVRQHHWAAVVSHGCLDKHAKLEWGALSSARSALGLKYLLFSIEVILIHYYRSGHREYGCDIL